MKYCSRNKKEENKENELLTHMIMWINAKNMLKRNKSTTEHNRSHDSLPMKQPEVVNAQRQRLEESQESW